MTRHRIRTVRCILSNGEQHLLAVHRGARRWGRDRWGLVGGHLDTGEAPEAAACREVHEELGIRIGPDQLAHVEDFRYKGGWHRVFAAPWFEAIGWFDRGELLRIGWHSLDEVAVLERRDRLHAGFEREAIDGLLRLPCWERRTAGRI